MKKRNILLVNPPFYRLMGSHYNGMSLGLAYLCSVLRKAGHECVIYNADYLDSNTYKNQVELVEAGESYKSILSNTNDRLWNEVSTRIIDFNPDMVGLSCYTANTRAVKIITGLIKEKNAKIQTIVGGVHPTLSPESLLDDPNTDIVVRGEAEETIVQIADGVEKSEIPGISFKRENGKIISNENRIWNENLDSLPIPDRDNYMIPLDIANTGYLITSRGCPFACTYCASPRLCGRKVRFRSTDLVFDEIEYLNRKRGITRIYFQDDTFTLRPERVVSICNKIIENGISLEWICDTRVDKINEDLLRLMKKSGCTRIKIGAESGDDEILKSVRKGFDTSDIKSAVKMIKQVGIPITAYLMIGYPGQTDSSVKKTIEFANEIDADYYSLSILAPYYGTEIFESMRCSGLIEKEHWEYFYHQNRDLLKQTLISEEYIEKFLNLNNRGKTGRI